MMVTICFYLKLSVKALFITLSITKFSPSIVTILFKAGIKALKVMVIHSHVVAHQVFALRLITWLDSVLAHSEGFRALFSRILTEQETGPSGRRQPSLLENILKHDTVLWKAARSAVHHLLISGA